MELSTSVVLLAAAVGVLLAISVQAATHAVTIAHEGGHALFTLLMGGSVERVTLGAGGTGLTESRLPDWLARVVVLAAGYLGPSVFGLLAIFLMLGTGDPAVVLWMTIGLLAMLLVVAGNAAAWMKITALGVLLYLVARSGSDRIQEFVALTWIWWLLIGAVTDGFAIVASALAGGGSGDGKALRDLTYVPRVLWDLFFLTGTAVALVIGAGQLLGLIGPRYS